MIRSLVFFLHPPGHLLQIHERVPLLSPIEHNPAQ
jgi:hypothetical protein